MHQADAEFVVEEEGRANISYSLFGMDANGSKYFDGEVVIISLIAPASASTLPLPAAALWLSSTAVQLRNADSSVNVCTSFLLLRLSAISKSGGA